MNENTIRKHSKSALSHYPFSILLPSWNNLDYLKLCIDSIRKHSSETHQIIVLVNEGTDGTVAYLQASEDQHLDFVHAEQNIGICYGLNACRSLIKGEYVAYLNDDMYVLPKWDEMLLDKINELKTRAFMMSGTLIEPRDSGNSCVVIKDFGDDLESFEEEALLDSYQQLKKNDWSGSMWPPNVVHIDYWDLVGGMSVEFSPGMYSDPDLAKKLFEAGVREFVGVGSSLVYHFGSKSTKRVKQNIGRKTFALKWGLTANQFKKDSLNLGGPIGSIPHKPSKDSFIQKIKRSLMIWK